MRHHLVLEPEAVEREYRLHRESVLAMLRADFYGVPDHEEIYQEAWTEALELKARGTQITNLGGLLRTIAWRRARDHLRGSHPIATDPGSLLFERQTDPTASPEEQVHSRVDAASIRHAVDSLDDRHAAVIKLRFDLHLDSAEVRRRLGISSKRLEAIITEAYVRLESALQVNADGDSEWRRRQRSLLLACETGVASGRQRRRARRMVNDDPACRAMLREIRATLEHIAAVLPLPLLTQESEKTRSRVSFGLSDRLLTARDQLTDVASRAASHAPSLEQSSSTGLAGLAGGAGAKLALVCVVVGSGTAVCLDLGGVTLTGDPPATHPQTARTHPRRTTPPRDETAVVVLSTPHRHSPAPKRRSATTRPKTARPTVTSASAPAAPSPAPSGSTEFAAGSSGSASSTPSPAAAPTGGAGEFLP